MQVPLHLLPGGCGGISRADLSPPLLSPVAQTSQPTRLPERRPAPPQSRLLPALSEFLRPSAQPPLQPIAANWDPPGAHPREEMSAPANYREGRGGRGASRTPRARAHGERRRAARTGHARVLLGPRGGVSERRSELRKCSRKFVLSLPRRVQRSAAVVGSQKTGFARESKIIGQTHLWLEEENRLLGYKRFLRPQLQRWGVSPGPGGIVVSYFVCG